MSYRCKCDVADFCRTVYKESLRTSIVALKQNKDSRSNNVLFTLLTTHNLLSELNCYTGLRLRARINYLCTQIKPDRDVLSSDEKEKLNILITELETFSYS